MLETSARLLRLLSLMETRGDWTGPQLAERLGVTTRTVRNDIERLRSLGYPVDGTPGVNGGYRLGIGAALPPLLLDDDEAGAVGIGLRAPAGGAGGGVAGQSRRAPPRAAGAGRRRRPRPRLARTGHRHLALPGAGDGACSGRGHRRPPARGDHG